MRGMILAAGQGTRLRPLTFFRAKPAVPFLNRPLVCHCLDFFRKAGVREVAINLHHLPESVLQAVEGCDLSLHFSREPRLLGTAGALAKVRDFLRDDTFVLCNGKIYFEVELTEALQFHREEKAAVTMVLRPYTENLPFNPLYMDTGQNIVSFTTPARSISRPNHAQPPSLASQHDLKPFVFTGLQILEPFVLDFIPEGPSDSVNDIYPVLMNQGHSIRGFVSPAYWAECSTPSRYLSKSLEVLERRGLSQINGQGLRGKSRKVVAGRDCRSSATSVLDQTILWENVEIGEDCRLQGVVVTSQVHLPAGIHLKNSVVTNLSESIEEFYNGRFQRIGQCAVWPLEQVL